MDPIELYDDFHLNGIEKSLSYFIDLFRMLFVENGALKYGPNVISIGRSCNTNPYRNDACHI